MEKIRVVIRSFKSGIGYEKPFIPEAEFEAYRTQLIESVSSVMTHPSVDRVHVVINSDPASSFSERPFPDGTSPTSRILRKSFPQQSVVPVFAQTWGMNVGSAAPVNNIIQACQHEGIEYVLMLSKESEFQQELLDQAIEVASYQHLLALGFLRRRWWRTFQWQVPQNTCCLWNVSKKFDFGGFDPRCDGKGETFEVGTKTIPIAGMEDYYALLKMLKTHPHDLRWGMIGMRAPFEWDLSAKNPAEMNLHEMKIFRQQYVMRHYAAELFPDESWDSVMDRFFASCRVYR